MTVRVAVFASGGGSNLQALLDHFNSAAGAAGRIALVVSDRDDAGALTRARHARVRTAVVHVAGREPREVEADIVDLLEGEGIELIALAGYLRLVPVGVVNRWAGRILNIHPALLPAFGGKGMYGMRVHRAVLEAGNLVTGVTVHLVTERYDEGKPLVQWPVPVLRGDTPETLAARVLAVEHVVYPVAVDVAAQAVASGMDLSSMTQLLWGARGWGFDADAGSFVWHGSDAVGGAWLRRLIGLDKEGAT